MIMRWAPIHAYYDGKVIVPDEPVDLPAGTRLTISLETVDEPIEENQSLEERLKRLDSAFGIIEGPPIPPEALRREEIYRDDDV